MATHLDTEKPREDIRGRTGSQEDSEVWTCLGKRHWMVYKTRLPNEAFLLLISKSGRIRNYLNHLDSRLPNLGYHKHASDGIKQLLKCREDEHLEPHEDNNYWIHSSWYIGNANDEMAPLPPGFWVPGLQMADLVGEERDDWDEREESRHPVSRISQCVCSLGNCVPSTVPGPWTTFSELLIKCLTAWYLVWSSTDGKYLCLPLCPWSSDLPRIKYQVCSFSGGCILFCLVPWINVMNKGDHQAGENRKKMFPFSLCSSFCLCCVLLLVSFFI